MPAFVIIERKCIKSPNVIPPVLSLSMARNTMCEYFDASPIGKIFSKISLNFSSSSMPLGHSVLKARYRNFTSDFENFVWEDITARSLGLYLKIKRRQLFHVKSHVKISTTTKHKNHP